MLNRQANILHNIVLRLSFVINSNGMPLKIYYFEYAKNIILIKVLKGLKARNCS